MYKPVIRILHLITHIHYIVLYLDKKKAVVPAQYCYVRAIALYVGLKKHLKVILSL